MTKEFATPWIQTLHGRAFDFEDMNSNEFSHQEIGGVLSRIPRFAGHSRWPYTVAQHSVLVSRCFFDWEDRLAGLLHDVPEVFVGDISAPLKYWLKSHGGTSALSELEGRIWDWVAVNAGLRGYDLGKCVKFVDRQALATEARDLMQRPPKPWIELPHPWKERIDPWHPDYAKDVWIWEYEALVDK